MTVNQLIEMLKKFDGEMPVALQVAPTWDAGAFMQTIHGSTLTAEEEEAYDDEADDEVQVVVITGQSDEDGGGCP